MRGDRHKRLTELKTGDGRPLQPRLLAEILRELARLEVVLRQIAELETEREATLKAAPVGTAAPDQVQHARSLRRLLAIGPETAAVLATEVFFRRFQNRRQLAGYVGLTPSPHMSGGLSREQGIGKAVIHAPEQRSSRRPGSGSATSRRARLPSGSVTASERRKAGCAGS